VERTDSVSVAAYTSTPMDSAAAASSSSAALELLDSRRAAR
jgi:hypothetical protein